MKHFLLAALLAAPALAQDTRHVTEPVIPPTCTRLDAALADAAGKLADSDEGKLDTARIQAALDQCKPGQAVELATPRSYSTDWRSFLPRKIVSGPAYGHVTSRPPK